MELNKEQKEKLKSKLIGFCDELGDIIKDRILKEVKQKIKYNDDLLDKILN